MRKTTQSFPLMPNALSPLHTQQRKRQAPRSLSIGASDTARNSMSLRLNKITKSDDESNDQVEKHDLNKKLSKNESFPSSSKYKGLFSTQSFRLAASKIAEASPRLGRRTKQNNDVVTNDSKTIYKEFFIHLKL